MMLMEGRRRIELAVAASLLAVGVAGWLGVKALQDDARMATSDCTPAVRLNGVVFNQLTYVADVRAPKHLIGTADVAECEDTRENSRGSYFPDAPRTVDVWSVEKFDPGEVVAVRGEGQLSGQLSVYTVSTLSLDQQAAITSTLETAR